MGKDVEFFGQVNLSSRRAEQWRAATTPKSASKKLPIAWRRHARALRAGDLLDALADEGVVETTSRTIRIAGFFEEGTFWESWASDLASAFAGVSRCGGTGWLWLTGDHLCRRLRADDDGLRVDTPSDRELAKARKHAAHKLLRRVPSGLDAETMRAVEAAVDRAVHGTKTSAPELEGFDGVVARVEQLSPGAVSAALKRAFDVPSKRGLAPPKKLFKDKAGLLQAARSSEIIEHRGVVIDVLSRIEPETCAALCVPLLNKRKTPNAYRAAILRGLAFANTDAAVTALVKAVFGKRQLGDSNDPVQAALHGLVRSPHPLAATRALDAMPRAKGRRGDAMFSRVAYVILERKETALRDRLAALAEDSSFDARALADVAVSLLGGSHSGNFHALALQ